MTLGTEKRAQRDAAKAAILAYWRQVRPRYERDQQAARSGWTPAKTTFRSSPPRRDAGATTQGDRDNGKPKEQQPAHYPR